MSPIILPSWIVATCVWGVLGIVGLALLAGSLALAVWLAEVALKKAKLLWSAAMFTYCYWHGLRLDKDGTWWDRKVRISWIGGWPCVSPADEEEDPDHA